MPELKTLCKSAGGPGLGADAQALVRAEGQRHGLDADAVVQLEEDLVRLVGAVLMCRRHADDVLAELDV